MERFDGKGKGMKNPNRLIMGAAISLAAIAAAIDHTKHHLPTPVEATEQMNYVIEGEEESSPCSMNIDNGTSDSRSEDENSSPCGLGD